MAHFYVKKQCSGLFWFSLKKSFVDPRTWGRKNRPIRLKKANRVQREATGLVRRGGG